MHMATSTSFLATQTQNKPCVIASQYRARHVVLEASEPVVCMISRARASPSAVSIRL